MTSGDFEHRNQHRWEEYERLVERLERRGVVAAAGQLPRRFRELCVDLSLAEARLYGARITERLNTLVIRGYELIYRTRRGGWAQAVAFVTAELPRTVRREWRLFWLCQLVFWLPFGAMMLSSWHDIRWLQAVLGANGMTAMEQKIGRAHV